MAQLFTNNATSTLAADITDSATSLTVATGHGARFPTPTSADYFVITLEKPDGTREILKVTARSGDTLSGITRAQEGTTAAAFVTGNTVELRVTAATIAAALVPPAQIYAGAMREIASVTTTGSQTTVTFSAIPATYRDLVVHISARGTAAAGSVDLRAQMNGDTGANYLWVLENRYGSANAATDTSFRAGNIPAATALASASGFVRITLPRYADVLRKQLFVENPNIDGGGTSNAYHNTVYGWWNSAAALTQVVLSLSSGAFLDGSTVTLYGIGGEVGGASLNPIYTKYDPFCPPAAPSSLDDEFNVAGTTIPAGWTDVGALTPTYLVSKGRLVFSCAGNGSGHAAAIEKTLPAGTFAIESHVTLADYLNYNQGGIYLRNATSGKIWMWRLARNSGTWGDASIGGEQYSSFTTRTAFSGLGGATLYDQTVFLRIQYDGTTLSFRASPNGIDFITFFSQAAATYFSGGDLPNRCGLMLNSFSSNAPSQAYSYFRYSATPTADFGRNIGVGSDGAVVESLPLILHNQVI